ncbi:HutD family protein [Serratia sp. JUb9]|uniref:HutD/Ves family protein n=1 Tax=unclassified Serratia (in: enterobacteria) TaxID=2647522 RepID=UPI000CF61B71|nr:MULTISPECIES: HutD family protein [unclassified Serratia (in: enterobacteria)]AVJ17347.1 HutD family protein [Serratia sp. MYb239]QNK30784.1 HutD family protein [Serratia sp. JUb9]
MLINRFDFADLPVSPWRNGGGETREIVCQPADGVDFDWRASIATIAQDGPFSAFDGIDRSITLLEGDGVHLFGDGIDHRLETAGEPFAFSGDAALQARLLGGISQDFNIMTRRGRWRATVRRLTAACELPAAHAGVWYVLRGEWQLPAETRLGARQGGWWPEAAHGGQAAPLSADALALWADLSRV